MNFYNMFMPKNILYFVIGMPVLIGSAVFILNLFEKEKKTHS